MLNLSKITDIPADDIADFTSVVLQTILEGGEEQTRSEGRED